MMNLKLERPIVFFDLEATGINVMRDRIVEICVVKVKPDGEREIKKRLINPEIPIPPQATEIHGISDDDVKNEPSFKQVSKSFFDFLGSCDLSGFNLLKFDIPLLVQEFKRANLTFETRERKVVDVQRIYHKNEPRTLAAAVRFYCNEELEGAHGSEADTLATIKVLEAQLGRYEEVPKTVDELDEYCNPNDPSFIDREGKLKWLDKEVVIGFGQKSGMSLKTLANTESSYLKWILRGDFNEEVKKIVRDALEGRFLEKTEESLANNMEINKI